MEATGRAAKRPLLLSLALLVLLVAGALVTRPAPVARQARPITASGTMPFAASFEEQVVASWCAGATCQMRVEGRGVTTPLGPATELAWGMVGASTSPCRLLDETLMLTATDGGGSLFISGTGQACRGANSSDITRTLSWVISSGTGHFSGASGYGTGTGRGATAIVAHYQGRLSFSGRGIPSSAGHVNYK